MGSIFKRIRVRNFKGYKDSGEIELRPLTIIVGPNNSGKSTIIQAILLLKQTLQDKSLEAPLVTSGAFVNMGSFFDIIRGGSSSKERTFGIEITIDPNYSFIKGLEPGSEPPGLKPEHLAVEFSFDKSYNRIKVHSSKIVQAGQTVFEVRDQPAGYFSPQIGALSDKVQIDFSHFLPVVKPARAVQWNEADREVVGALLTTQIFAHVWSETFDKVIHIPPLRVRIPWYGVVGTMPGDVGPGGENLLRALASVERVGRTQKSLIEQLDAWISSRFKMLRRVKLAKIDLAGSIQSLHGDEVDGCDNINLAGMGEGLSQVLPIIAKSMMLELGSCLLVEQPEIHLHPAAQAEIGDLFIAAVKQDEGRQIIVETHSEHLLLRIRRRVAEGRIDPDLISVLYVEKSGGESKVRQLKLTKEGHFLDWPEGFFEEGYKEALALALAPKNRGSV